MKIIELTQGQVAFVPDSFYVDLNCEKWYAHKRNNTFYAVRASPIDENGKQNKIYMHRVILNAPPGIKVEHIDGNGLNNQLENLQLKIIKYDKFLIMLKNHGDSNLCLLWPYALAPSGYGVFKLNSETLYVHQLSLERKLGRNILSGFYACHTCYIDTFPYNRNCFNPKHLYEGTPQQNSDDMIKNGTIVVGESRYNHVLTEDEVIEIRKNHSPRLLSFQEIGEIYNVKGGTIHSILVGKSWKYLL